MALGSSLQVPPPPYQYARGGPGVKPQLTIEMQTLTSFEGVELDLGQTEIRLRLPDSDGTSRIELPAEAASGALGVPTAKFSKKRGQLVISWPSNSINTHDNVISTTSVVEQPASLATSCHTKIGPPEAQVSVPALSNAESQPPVAVASPAACGSLWNVNSWHWEDKNCMDLVRAEIQLALQRCSDTSLKHVTMLGGASILFSKVQVKGDGSFALRRGKRILCFEVMVSFAWEARDEHGGPLGAKGSGTITELTQDDDVPCVAIEVSATFSGGSDAKVAGSWMQTHGSRVIAECLSTSALSSAILKAEEDRIDTSADAALRAHERAKTYAAEQVMGEVREKLATEQRSCEEARRVHTEVVQGSMWNTNSWHWEERPRTEWAHTWLKKELQDLSISLLGGLATASFSAVQVSGDASISIRKGRSIVLFQLDLRCDWTIREEIVGVGEGCGLIHVPDFTCEEGAEGASIKIDTASSSGKRTKKPPPQLMAALQREALPKMRQVLMHFMQTLKAQLP